MEAIVKQYNSRFVVTLFIALSVCLNAAPSHAKEFTDGPRVREVLSEQVKNLFAAGKYAELDAMADKFRHDKTRFPDGVWKLQVFYTGFKLYTRTPEWGFTQYISKAEEWRKARPKSVTAQTVLAGVWADYAWQARGGGYAGSVKQDAWPRVRERHDTAWKIINEPLAHGVADCPERQNLRLAIAKSRGVGRKEFEALFQQAIRQEPGFYHHYATKADYLLPKWHGKEGEWQQFITKVAERNPGGQGAMIYARTAWSMFLGDDWQEFNGSGVSWERMKAGFYQIDRTYPNSPWILNTTAKFACRAGDKKALSDLFKRITPDNFYPEAWDGEDMNTCRRLVGLAPLAAANLR